MTIRLRIISGEDEEFLRDVEISGGATFLELHNFIQKMLNFDDGQMASFFITDEDWQKNEEITLMDMNMDDSSDSLIMSETPLNKFIQTQKQRLLYVFDFFNERSLFLETYEISDAHCMVPKLLKEQGEAPKQLDMSGIMDENIDDASKQIDLDLSADELLGFSDSDFDDDPMISYTDDLEDL